MIYVLCFFCGFLLSKIFDKTTETDLRVVSSITLAIALVVSTALWGNGLR